MCDSQSTNQFINNFQRSNRVSLTNVNNNIDSSKLLTQYNQTQNNIIDDTHSTEIDKNALTYSTNFKDSYNNSNKMKFINENLTNKIQIKKCDSLSKVKMRSLKPNYIKAPNTKSIHEKIVKNISTNTKDTGVSQEISKIRENNNFHNNNKELNKDNLNNQLNTLINKINSINNNESVNDNKKTNFNQSPVKMNKERELFLKKLNNSPKNKLQQLSNYNIKEYTGFNKRAINYSKESNVFSQSMFNNKGISTEKDDKRISIEDIKDKVFSNRLSDSKDRLIINNRSNTTSGIINNTLIKNEGKKIEKSILPPPYSGVNLSNKNKNKSMTPINPSIAKNSSNKYLTTEKEGSKTKYKIKSNVLLRIKKSLSKDNKDNEHNKDNKINTNNDIYLNNRDNINTRNNNHNFTFKSNNYGNTETNNTNISFNNDLAKYKINDSLMNNNLKTRNCNNHLNSITNNANTNANNNSNSQKPKYSYSYCKTSHINNSNHLKHNNTIFSNNPKNSINNSNTLDNIANNRKIKKILQTGNNNITKTSSISNKTKQSIQSLDLPELNSINIKNDNSNTTSTIKFSMPKKQQQQTNLGNIKFFNVNNTNLSIQLGQLGQAGGNIQNNNHINPTNNLNNSNMKKSSLSKTNSMNNNINNINTTIETHLFAKTIFDIFYTSLKYNIKSSQANDNDNLNDNREMINILVSIIKCFEILSKYYSDFTYISELLKLKLKQNNFDWNKVNITDSDKLSGDYALKIKNQMTNIKNSERKSMSNKDLSNLKHIIINDSADCNNNKDDNNSNKASKSKSSHSLINTISKDSHSNINCFNQLNQLLNKISIELEGKQLNYNNTTNKNNFNEDIQKDSNTNNLIQSSQLSQLLTTLRQVMKQINEKNNEVEKTINSLQQELLDKDVILKKQQREIILLKDKETKLMKIFFILQKQGISLDAAFASMEKQTVNSKYQKSVSSSNDLLSLLNQMSSFELKNKKLLKNNNDNSDDSIDNKEYCDFEDNNIAFSNCFNLNSNLFGSNNLSGISGFYNSNNYINNFDQRVVNKKSSKLVLNNNSKSNTNNKINFIDKIEERIEEPTDSSNNLNNFNCIKNEDRITLNKTNKANSSVITNIPSDLSNNETFYFEDKNHFQKFNIEQHKIPKLDLDKVDVSLSLEEESNNCKYMNKDQKKNRNLFIREKKNHSITKKFAFGSNYSNKTKSGLKPSNIDFNQDNKLTGDKENNITNKSKIIRKHYNNISVSKYKNSNLKSKNNIINANANNDIKGRVTYSPKVVSNSNIVTNSPNYNYINDLNQNEGNKEKYNQAYELLEANINSNSHVIEEDKQRKANTNSNKKTNSIINDGNSENYNVNYVKTYTHYKDSDNYHIDSNNQIDAFKERNELREETKSSSSHNNTNDLVNIGNKTTIPSNKSLPNAHNTKEEIDDKETYNNIITNNKNELKNVKPITTKPETLHKDWENNGKVINNDDNSSINEDAKSNSNKRRIIRNNEDNSIFKETRLLSKHNENDIDIDIDSNITNYYHDSSKNIIKESKKSLFSNSKKNSNNNCNISFNKEIDVLKDNNKEEKQIGFIEKFSQYKPKIHFPHMNNSKNISSKEINKNTYLKQYTKQTSPTPKKSGFSEIENTETKPFYSSAKKIKSFHDEFNDMYSQFSETWREGIRKRTIIKN